MDEKNEVRQNIMRKLKKISLEIRKKVLNMSYNAQTAHLASSLSCVDIMSALYYSVLNIKKKNIKKINRDRFILSKGHAATSLYAILAQKKILNRKKLNDFCKPNSYLEEHPSPFLDGVEAATGSLGHGLSIGCGLALGSKISKIRNKVCVLLSDGECNEGSVWEAAMFASAKKLNNLYAIIDCNKWQATERTDKIVKIKSFKDKFKSFGWNAKVIDGHNFKQIINSLATNRSFKPRAIIANTIKGKGVSFMEDDNNWHYRSPNYEEYIAALKELK